MYEGATFPDILHQDGLRGSPKASSPEISAQQLQVLVQPPYESTVSQPHWNEVDRKH